MARVAVSELTLKTTFDAEAPQRAKVGDVIHSMLTEAQFQAQRDSTWVLMDGRDLSITNPGSAYQALTGQSVLPDSRGRFLRGLDTSGTVDPDGASRALGSSQADALQGHFHKQYYSDNTGALNGGGSLYRNFVPATNANIAAVRNDHIRQPISDGINGTPRTAKETRPKNVTINIFIKINE